MPYLEVVSQVCILDLAWKHQKPLDGTYLADFGIDITLDEKDKKFSSENWKKKFR